MPSLPEDYGATCLARRRWEDTRAEELEARWKRKPPAERLGCFIGKLDWNLTLEASEEERVNGPQLWLWPQEVTCRPGDIEEIKAVRKAQGMVDRDVEIRSCSMAVTLEMAERGRPQDLMTTRPDGGTKS